MTARRATDRRRRRWTRISVPAAARIWATENGRGPTATDWARATDRHPAHSTVERLYRNEPGGAWAALWRDAGLDTEDELAEAILEFERRGRRDTDELERHCSFIAAGGEPDRARLLRLARSALERAGRTPAA